MKTICTLACAAVLAASGAPSFAASTKHPVASASGRFAQRAVSAAPASIVLYDQSTGDTGAAISSQNFGSDLDAYDDEAADDFSVPAGHVWRVKEVDVIGGYTEGTAESQHIIIYRDHKGAPGTIVADCDGLHGIDNGGSFAIKIPKSCRIRLRSGTYWVAVIANQSVGQWLWEARAPIVGNEAIWQNPNGGWGLCNNGGTLEECFGLPDDLMFTLKGSDRLK